LAFPLLKFRSILTRKSTDLRAHGLGAQAEALFFEDARGMEEVLVLDNRATSVMLRLNEAFLEYSA